jgi:hypothetical protein
MLRQALHDMPLKGAGLLVLKPPPQGSRVSANPRRVTIQLRVKSLELEIRFLVEGIELRVVVSSSHASAGSA